jgi:hypothetical protein
VAFLMITYIIRGQSAKTRGFSLKTGSAWKETQRDFVSFPQSAIWGNIKESKEILFYFKNGVGRTQNIARLIML